MPVFRAEKTNDYAVIAKHHLKNRAISYKAKGLMTFMLCVPDDWDYSMAGLAVLASDGIDGVRSGVKELEKHGYLTRRRIRDAGGKLGDIEYTIHEIPQPPRNIESNNLPAEASSNHDTPISENPILASPILEKPILDFPTLDKPTQENPTQCSNKELSINGLNINESNNKVKQPCPAIKDDLNKSQQLSLCDVNPLHANQQAERLTVEKAQGAGKPVDHAMTLVEQQFELFWQVYPRKAGKKAARKEWMDIKPDAALFSIIMTAVNTAKQYWSHHEVSAKHIPHPSTWLIEERWDDEFLPEQLTGGAGLYKNESQAGGDRVAIIGANYTIGGDYVCKQSWTYVLWQGRKR